MASKAHMRRVRAARAAIAAEARKAGIDPNDTKAFTEWRAARLQAIVDDNKARVAAKKEEP